VTTIGNGAFMNCYSLIEIIIPASVTEFGDSNPYWGIFTDCISLEKIEFECTQIKQINSATFSGCLSLKEIKIPENVESIGENAFTDCIALQKIEIPTSLTNIDKQAFSNCIGLKEIINKSSLIFTLESLDYGEIARYALKVSNKGQIETIDDEYITTDEGFILRITNFTNYLISYSGQSTRPILPKTINGKKYSCQYMDETLQNIELSNDFTSIDNYMFRNCVSLKTIIIPKSVTKIESNAFRDCINLESVQFSEDSLLTKIEESAFNCCISLKEITIPKSVVSIGEWAFAECTSLTSITMSDNVTSIGEYAFYTCTSITNVYYKGSLADWCGISFGGYDSSPMNRGALDNLENHIFMLDQNEKFYEVEEIEIPSTITTIGQNQFCGFNMTRLEVPNNITHIGEYAFSDCYKLKDVIISDSVISIELGAFERCIALENVKLSNNLKILGSSTFFCCFSLKSIIIPSSLTTIGSSVFEKCTSLESIIIPSNITTIESTAFFFCVKLKSIIIPSSVTVIEDEAFYYCPQLTIYCESEIKPSNWEESWNYSNCPVVWGYKSE